jgi:hypothetical protein
VRVVRANRNRKLVDSPLEGNGFELQVPRCTLITNSAALVALTRCGSR